MLNSSKFAIFKKRSLPSSRQCHRETNFKKYFDLDIINLALETELPTILCTQVHFICDVDFTGNPQYICNVVCFGEIFPLRKSFWIEVQASC